MRTSTEIARLNGDAVVVDAFLTPTPGLLVVAPMAEVANWAVTHDRTGFVVAFCDDPEQAQAIATHLGPLADWTQSGETLNREWPTFRARHRAVLARFGGWNHGDRPRWTDERLAR